MGSSHRADTIAFARLLRKSDVIDSSLAPRGSAQQIFRDRRQAGRMRLANIVAELRYECG
jgi:hypothetical protein